MRIHILTLVWSFVKASIMLCDSAQVAEGKLYILGGGWSVTGPGMAPMAVALRIDVDWAQAPEAHHWELFLVDQDGGEVAFEGPDGEMQPIEVRVISKLVFRREFQKDPTSR